LKSPQLLVKLASIKSQCTHYCYPPNQNVVKWEETSRRSNLSFVIDFMNLEAMWNSLSGMAPHNTNALNAISGNFAVLKLALCLKQVIHVTKLFITIDNTSDMILMSS
jgi:hypothetical protein